MRCQCTATQLSIWSYRGHRFAAVTRCVLLGHGTSIVRGNSRDIGEKAKQNSASVNAKFNKCFQFLCNNSDWTWLFNALTFARSLGRCWKPRPKAAVFNTSQGTWRMLMHEKPCLIPILSPCYVPFSQLTLRYNLPTSAVSALIMLNYQSYIKGSKDTISGEATLFNLLLIPFEKGSTRKGNNLLPVLSFLGGRFFQQGLEVHDCKQEPPNLSFFQTWQKIYKCIKFPEISFVYFFQFCDGYYGID